MMWDDGYNSEVGYTHTYCSDLSPLKIKYALIINGISCKKIATACELGWPGLTLNFNAIDKSISWYGCDFIPNHVANAREISEEVGTNLRLSEASFQR